MGFLIFVIPSRCFIFTLLHHHVVVMFICFSIHFISLSLCYHCHCFSISLRFLHFDFPFMCCSINLRVLSLAFHYLYVSLYLLFHSFDVPSFILSIHVYFISFYFPYFCIIILSLSLHLLTCASNSFWFAYPFVLLPFIYHHHCFSALWRFHFFCLFPFICVSFSLFYILFLSFT